MAFSKHAKQWAEKQRSRVANRCLDVPPGPRTKETWAEAREALRAGLGSCMRPLEGWQDPSSNSLAGSVEPGADLLHPALRDLQDACRKTARESLSTTATVLDPMQFTRMVSGRPVQVIFEKYVLICKVFKQTQHPKESICDNEYHDLSLIPYSGLLFEDTVHMEIHTFMSHMISLC